MSMLSSLLPEYDAIEFHDIVVNEPVESVFDAVKTVDFGKSKIIVTLFKMRGIPSGKLNLQGLVNEGSFSQLGEDAPRETVLGFMVTDTLQKVDDLDAFTSNSAGARLRIGWDFQCVAIDDVTTRLSTETRVALTGTMSKIFFRCYWLVIRPFSGWIRRIMLRLIKEKAEAV